MARVRSNYPHFRMLDNSGINYHAAWEWKSLTEALECAQGYRKDGYLARNVMVVIGGRKYWVTYVRKNRKVK